MERFINLNLLAAPMNYFIVAFVLLVGLFVFRQLTDFQTSS